MSQRRLGMRNLRELLRLKLNAQISHRKIALALNISASTVSLYVKAAKAASLTWSTIQTMSDDSIEQQLVPYCQQLSEKRKNKSPIDLVTVHKELQHKGVTRELLWKEYKEKVMSPVSYPEFCRQYRAFKKTLKPSMRQQHKLGKKTFIDYAGPTVPIINKQTGEIKKANVFIALLGASNFTYAEATFTRAISDWLQSHVRMFNYFGGVTELLIPDNEKSGVNGACYYEPEINVQYAALAAHYDTVVLPTRPYKPKDKAKVENAVLVVERWILARIRHHTFFTLDELNQVISKLLVELNDKPFQKLPGSRRSHFEEHEKKCLKPLPAFPYSYKEIKKVIVRLDYHIEVKGHYYSVPHHLISKAVHYHLGENTIDVFYKGVSVASHLRSNKQGQSTTINEHMPKAHREHQQWSPQCFLSWAENIDTIATKIAEHLIKTKPHPECCYRIHLGLKKLYKQYGKTRFIEASHYAFEHLMISYTHLRSILKTRVDQLPPTASNDQAHTVPVDSHKHVRGAHYYSTTVKEKDDVTTINN